MRIIVVGGAGTIGTAVVELLSARHDVVVAGRQSGDVQVDISSGDSVRSMYRRIGSFDGLACAAGEAHFGPFENAAFCSLTSGSRAGVGDFINVPRGTVHRFHNQSTETMRMIVTFTPAGIENFFQETLQPTLDPTADIPDNFDAVATRYATAAPLYGMQFVTE